jgi:hypothetical protein
VQVLSRTTLARVSTADDVAWAAVAGGGVLAGE